MTPSFEFDRNAEYPGGAKIKIIGVGGCGGNAINNMIELGIDGVEFIACNTDLQALSNSKAENRIQLGRETTKGLGAGFNPNVGQKAAEEDREKISELVRNTDMLFITAGMGKGTGTGAAPVVASIAKNLGILTIGIVTKPFDYEGGKVIQTADRGIEELRKHVDTLIVVQNQKILKISPRNTRFKEAYNLANEILYRAAKGISEIVTQHGHVNVDFADVRNIMSNAGDAVMGSASRSGEGRALQAAQEAISSPLLDGISIKGSSGVLVNITGDVNIEDVEEVMNFVREQAGPDSHIIHGIVEKEDRQGELTVTVIATGFNKKIPGNARSSEPSQPIQSQHSASSLRVVRTAPPDVLPQKPAPKADTDTLTPIQSVSKPVLNTAIGQDSLFPADHHGVPPKTHLPIPFESEPKARENPVTPIRTTFNSRVDASDTSQPTYIRNQRNVSQIPPDAHNPVTPLSDGEEKPVTEIKPSGNDERIRKANPDRPAFLRRIMD